jgi:hypothetical protein
LISVRKESRLFDIVEAGVMKPSDQIGGEVVD